MTAIPPLGSPRPAPEASNSAAAAGFEAIFLRLLMTRMRATVPGDSLLGGNAVTTASQLLDSALADSVAPRAPLGLGALAVSQDRRR